MPQQSFVDSANTETSKGTDVRARGSFRIMHLLIGTAVIVVPMSVLANLESFQPSHTLTSPVVLACCAVFMLVAAGMGGSFAGRRGAFLATIFAGCVWGLVALCGVLVGAYGPARVHATLALATTLAICFQVWRIPPEGTNQPEEMLERLKASRDQRRSSSKSGRGRGYES